MMSRQDHVSTNDAGRSKQAGARSASTGGAPGGFGPPMVGAVGLAAVLVASAGLAIAGLKPGLVTGKGVGQGSEGREANQGPVAPANEPGAGPATGPATGPTTEPSGATPPETDGGSKSAEAAREAALVQAKAAADAVMSASAAQEEAGKPAPPATVVPPSPNARNTVNAAPAQPAGQAGQPAGANAANELEERMRRDMEERARRAAAARGGGTATTPSARPVVNQGAQSGAALPGGKREVRATDAATGQGTVRQPTVVDSDDGMFRWGPFPEGADLKLLIQALTDTLGIQVVGMDTQFPEKKVFLPQQVALPREKLLAFLNSLLDQHNLVLIKDPVGLFILRTKDQIPAQAPDNDPFSATRIIQTKGIKPSLLQQPLTNILRGGGGQPGQPGVAGPITYMDDLGVIIVSDTPNRIAVVEGLIEQLAREMARQEFKRFELSHISASVARQRILELIGRVPQRSGATDPNAAAIAAQQQMAAGGAVGSITNLAERLTTDPAGNALIFRGREDELDLLSRTIKVVDVTSTLVAKFYPVGGAARQIVTFARRSGLGDVIVSEGDAGASGLNNRAFGVGEAVPGGGINAAFAGQGGIGGQGEGGGPVFVIDSQSRGFLFVGTASQHEHLETMIKTLEPLTEAEAIVYEFYKLRNAKSEEVSEIVRSLVTNSLPSGGGTDLVPGLSSNRAGNQPRRINPPPGANNPLDPARQATGPTAVSGSEIGDFASADVFVLADEPNNQVIVKAAKRLQPQFRRLIDRLDQRRPQVYIEAMIVTVDDDDTLDLSVESQLIRVGGQTIAARSIWTTPAAATSLQTPAAANVGRGITAALIKSDEVPIIINALAVKTDTRIIASPKLLVDDNEEAELSAIRQVPTQTQSQSGSAGTTLTGFGGFEDAGSVLKVKPQISSGDYLRLEYELELSSFIGEGTGNLPPPRSVTNFQSKSVTVPSDSTIVVGGLTVEDVSDTRARIPLIGDIPLVGLLFSDTSRANRKRTIYVFITPRIMRDATFDDARLLTKGPLIAVKIPERLPPVEPVTIEIGRGFSPAGQAPAPGQAPEPMDPQNMPVAPPAPVSTGRPDGE